MIKAELKAAAVDSAFARYGQRSAAFASLSGGWEGLGVRVWGLGFGVEGLGV